MQMCTKSKKLLKTIDLEVVFEDLMTESYHDVEHEKYCMLLSECRTTHKINDIKVFSISG